MRKYKIIHYLFFNIFFNCLLLQFLFSIDSSGQVSLVNPSFEDDPADATTPMGWHECNSHTTPDILPGFWGVYDEPADGETYVGLITRSNSTNEALGQRMSQPLTPDLCYQLKLELAYSKTYAGFNQPIKLRVWIGNNKCEKRQLIQETNFIDHSEWKTYLIQFVPDHHAEYIIFESFYSNSPFSHQGNILIDAISDIVLCGKA